MSEANKELVRRHFEELFNRKDPAVADERLLAQFPDLHMRIEAIVAEGDTVVARQSHWFRVADGRLAEHWATREDLPAMLQLGVVQPPGGPPA